MESVQDVIYWLEGLTYEEGFWKEDRDAAIVCLKAHLEKLNSLSSTPLPLDGGGSGC